MSLVLVFQTFDNNPIANGVTVVIDGTKAREYDAKVDDASDIFGVVCPKERLLGRELIGGEIFNTSDFYQVDQYHNYVENYPENENYDPNFNVVADNSYVYVLYIGLGVINSDQTINPIWKLVNANHSATTTLYLLH